MVTLESQIEGAGLEVLEWYRTGDVARIAGVARETICRWCDSGRLGHLRLGVQRRIYLVHLQAWWDEAGRGTADT